MAQREARGMPIVQYVDILASPLAAFEPGEQAAFH
jgi:hypothetical protein